MSEKYKGCVPCDKCDKDCSTYDHETYEELDRLKAELEKYVDVVAKDVAAIRRLEDKLAAARENFACMERAGAEQARRADDNFREIERLRALCAEAAEAIASTDHGACMRGRLAAAGRGEGEKCDTAARPTGASGVGR